MNSRNSPGLNPQVNNTSVGPFHEYEPAEIAVARNKNAVFEMRAAKKLMIGRACEANFRDADYIVAQASKKFGSDSIDVMIGEKLHGVEAR
jgi:hypothetical protein